MLKNCIKCRRTFATPNLRRVNCYTCASQDRYLKINKHFTSEEVVEDLKGKGFIAKELDVTNGMHHIEFLTPGRTQPIRVRLVSKWAGTHLVARSDDHDQLKYIPTCYCFCQGCYKCTLAGALNGESAEEARKRKRDPRGWKHPRREVRLSPSRRHDKSTFTPCTPPPIDVYSPSEDTDS